MVALLPIILSILFVGVLVSSRQKLRPARRALQTNPGPQVTRHLEAVVRRGSIDRRALSEQVRCTAKIAPTDAPDAALVLSNLDGSPLKTISIAEISMSRAWAKGRLVVARGESRRDHGSSWPLNPTDDGWEVKIVTASGAVYHCAGDAAPSVERDLARLHQRINVAVLALAS